MNPLAWLHKLPAPIKRLLGIGAERAVEAAIDAVEKHAGAVVPKPHKRHDVQARPIGERARRAEDDTTPARPPRDGGRH